MKMKILNFDAFFGQIPVLKYFKIFRKIKK